MTVFAISGADILVAGVWRNDAALVVQQDIIAAIVPIGDIEPGIEQLHLGGGFLLPGFIDTQVNGGGGVLFNDAPTVEGIRAIADAHRQFGTTGLLPTLISDDLSVVARAIAAVDAAISAGVPGVLGIHIEGPFLNESKRGIHDASKFRVLDAQAIDLLSSLKRGKTLVTLAPELVGAEIIIQLRERGILIAAGHSLATYEEMQNSIAAGITGVTHLFNAMTQLESRAPGIVGATLENTDIFAGLIVDGHHVHPAALRIAYAARRGSGLMLVTDAMPTVGATSKTFNLGGQLITAQDGACTSADGTLAGSDLDMAQALRNAMIMMHIDLAAASRMASEVPAQFLGLHKNYGTLSVGARADIVHLDTMHDVRATWIGGQHQVQGQ
jgi:N-acetylglucosamine-6-phosphate deacetylase